MAELGRKTSWRLPGHERSRRVRGFLAAVCVLCVVGCGAPEGRNAGHPEPYSFGVIADIQWGDKETGGNRYYRAALGKLEKCVADLNGRDLAFTIQLGDFIDGQKSRERTLSDLDRVVDVFNRLSMPKYHVVGNHCLVAGKEALREKLGLSSFYYDFTVPRDRGWRFVVLDGNDAGYGVIGDEQLEWLKSTLAQADKDEEKVIVFNHFALLKSAARHHRMKAPEPVLKLIEQSGCVVAYLAGHDHAGGYAFRNGVHHITLKGMVESPEETAYAVIEVHPDRLKEIGFGAEPSRDLPIGAAQSTAEKATVR